MKNTNKLVIFRVVNTVLLLFLIISCTGSQKKPVTSDKQDFKYIDYNWSLKSLNGENVNFAQYKNKVIFINIWATWCPPCVKEMPDIQQLYETVKSERIEFVLASSESPVVIRKYLQNNQITLPVYIYSSNLPAVLKAEYIPRTFIIDRFGKIVYQKTGKADWNTPDIQEFLRFLANVKIKD
jgi:thiol-disulfide isomerase/thioredoxin